MLVQNQYDGRLYEVPDHMGYAGYGDPDGLGFPAFLLPIAEQVGAKLLPKAMPLLKKLPIIGSLFGEAPWRYRRYRHYPWWRPGFRFYHRYPWRPGFPFRPGLPMPAMAPPIPSSLSTHVAHKVIAMLQQQGLVTPGGPPPEPEPVGPPPEAGGAPPPADAQAGVHGYMGYGEYPGYSEYPGYGFYGAYGESPLDQQDDSGDSDDSDMSQDPYQQYPYQSMYPWSHRRHWWGHRGRWGRGWRGGWGRHWGRPGFRSHSIIGRAMHFLRRH